MAEHLTIMPGWEDAVRSAGWRGAGDVFADGRVQAWRVLRERDNAVFAEGGVRWHVKRHAAVVGSVTPAAIEVAAAGLLREHGISTAELVAWGELGDGRSFTVSSDLTGYASCQALLRGGTRFAEVSAATAGLAARLHAAGLHHRDLYLCHFFLRMEDQDCRLIDVGRVGRLPGWPFRRRWVIKDLGQFVYSTREFGVGEAELMRWIEVYGATGADFRAAVRKADAIGRHDARLRGRQPGRNVSLPLPPAAAATLPCGIEAEGR